MGQSLSTIETYKVLQYFGKITENHYNLRSYNDYHGTDSISYLGTKIWDILFL